MSEKPPAPFARPQSLDDGDLNWAYDPTTGSDTPLASTEPDAARKLNGWAASGPADPPPADMFNWLFRELTRAASHLDKRVPRRFLTMDEAITATVEGDLFYVEPTDIPAELAATGSAPLGDTIVAMCTDGEFVFLGDAVGAVYCVRASDPGTQVWTTALSNIVAIACDGADVFVATRVDSGGQTDDELWRLDRSTGAATLIGSANEPIAMAAGGAVATNGERVAWVTGANARTIQHIDRTGASLGASTTWGTTGGVHVLRFLGGSLLAGGSAANGSNHNLRRIGLEDSDPSWFVAIGDTVNDLACDGRIIYCATTTTATPLVTVRLHDGASLASTAVDGEAGVAVAIDEDSLLFADGDGDLFLFHRQPGSDIGVRIRTIAGGAYATRGLCSDGAQYLAANNDQVDPLARTYAARLFRRVSATERHRLPYQQLAMRVR